jgi:hypothetical protein
MLKVLALSMFASALAVATALGDDAAPEMAAPVPPGRVHNLVVAVGGDRPQDFPAVRVDQIVQGMNQMIIQNCPGINIRWDGNIRYNPGLLAAGTNAALEKSFRDNHIVANVYWVYSIDDCAGVQAAGCTLVPGADEIVIDDQNDRANVVWLHERGHAEGLGHVQQNMDESAIPETDFDNVMFWKALESGHLLTSAQCDAFRRLTVGGGIHNGVVAVPIADVQAAPAMPAPLAQAPVAATLTPRAAKALQWTDHVAVDKLKELDEADLQSMADTILKAEPSPPWPHIMTALGYRNYKDFKAVSAYVMGLGSIEVPASTGANVPEVLHQSLKSRALIATKLAVPLATGLYVNQSGDLDSAVDLARYSQPGVAAAAVGRSLSGSFTDSATTALAISSASGDTNAANDVGAVAQQAFRLPENADAASIFGQKFRFTNETVESRMNSTLQAAPAEKVQLDPEKTAKLKAVVSKITKDGLDSYLVNGAGAVPQ